MKNYAPLTTLRLEDELFLKIKKIANIEERSFNKQVTIAVKEFVKNYEAQHGEVKVNVEDLYE